MAKKHGPKEWIPRGISNIMHISEVGRHKMSKTLRTYIEDFEEHAQDADFVSRDGWRWFSWYDLITQAEGMGEEAVVEELHQLNDVGANVGDQFVGIPPEPGTDA